MAFDISVGDLEWPTRCPALGIELHYRSESSPTIRTDASPSLDRLDPNKGYVKGNVRVISWRANKIKTDANADEIMAVAKWLMFA